MEIKKGDYFDLYQDRFPTRRVIAITNQLGGKCKVIDLDDGYDPINIDVVNEVDTILGNIFAWREEIKWRNTY